jgi:subtilisin family serine protease
MKKLTIIIIGWVWLLPATGRAHMGDSAFALKLGEEFAAVVRSAPADTVYDVLVSAGTDRTATKKIAGNASTLRARYRSVDRHLRKLAANRQSALLDDLADSRCGTKTSTIKSYWISNLVRVRTDREGLLTLAERADVARIYPNATVDLIAPIVAAGDAPADVTAATASLDAIGARQAWMQGITGKGRLIASIDTGVEGIHPALQDSWRGRQGDTAAAWFDPNDAAAPMDNNGHGTHVMGIMVGKNGSDTIGVAPDAEWICAAVIDRGSSLAATIADILDALEWVVDPDGDPSTTDDVPDVVCNSWGISQQIISPCDSVFFQAIDNVEAMGIVCIFAAGNEGPNSMTIRNPADHAGSPTSAFSIGAVNTTVEGYPVPSFSSRGPSACDGYSVKPEIGAPGVAIYSAWKGQTYRLMNGTSMAAPFVAASVALMRQYNPELTPEEIKQALLLTASDIGDPGEDNESGHGLLNLEAALAAVAPALGPEVAVANFAGDAHGDAIVAPGETVPLTVALTGSQSDAHNVVGELTPLDAGVTADVSEAYYGTIPAGATVDNVDAPFVISVAQSVSIGDTLTFQLTVSGDPAMDARTDTLALVCGLPANGDIGSLTNGAIEMSLTNFGMLGAGPGSQFDANGEGWRRTTEVSNVLYEAALMVTSAAGGLADASRGSALDFAPLEPVTTGLDPEGFSYATALFDDSRAQNPQGAEIAERVAMYPDLPAVTFVEWTVTNRSVSTMAATQCGLLVDIDLPLVGVSSERAMPVSFPGGFYNVADIGSRVAGLVALSDNLASLRHFQNSGGKLSLSESEKLQAMTPGSNDPDGGWGDAFVILASTPADLEPDESLTLTLAFVMADSPEQFMTAAADARNRWLDVTGVLSDQDDQAQLPRLNLAQNFPNPFNPETVIAYSLASPGHVRLEVFNLLGQSVDILVDGWNPAGRNTVSWDGTDAAGNAAASGVYFYRLTADNEIVTKKMVLLR